MKTIETKKQLKKGILVTLFAVAIALVSCNDDDNKNVNNSITPPTAAAFKNISEKGVPANTQRFTITAGDGIKTITSAKGVKLSINGDCLTKNGVPVTGTVDIEFIELFDKGTMLITNKPTMGIMSDGKKNLLISGGEFFIKATQGGVELQAQCFMNMVVPTALTNGPDNAMTFWTGVIDDEGELAWEQPMEGNRVLGAIKIQQDSYNLTFNSFGWTNVDRFYSDPRPKTTLLVDAPEGYDNKNSAIYLSYDGEGTNALAKLDTYTTDGLFSEHYGQIPIGLKCHIIFVTESNGQWRYAIKGVTVAAGDVYNFSLAETTVGTEAQLVAAINALP